MCCHAPNDSRERDPFKVCKSSHAHVPGNKIKKNIIATKKLKVASVSEIMINSQNQKKRKQKKKKQFLKHKKQKKSSCNITTSFLLI